jgi:hypothetical protein
VAKYTTKQLIASKLDDAGAICIHLDNCCIVNTIQSKINISTFKLTKRSQGNQWGKKRKVYKINEIKK